MLITGTLLFIKKGNESKITYIQIERKSKSLTFSIFLDGQIQHSSQDHS